MTSHTRHRHIQLEADGGSRGNPGVAGYGALLRDADSGAILAERAAPLGTASNNVAEYSGLIAGLQAVLDLDLADDADIEVRMDSKLVVEQMSGRWKIKHEDMRRLALQARDLARQIEWAGGTVSYQWIPRAQNGPADELSNRGMDGETVEVNTVAGPTSTVVPDVPDAPDVPAVPEPTFGEGRAPVADLVFSDETTPTLEGSCRVILVRHGVTEFTVQHRLDGRGGSDPELTALGQRQAQAAGEAVRQLVARSEPGPVRVVTSSLQRARQTGAAVAEALGAQAEVDSDWDEQAFGDWDGWSMEELVDSFGPELLRLRQDDSFARPGGESRADLRTRVIAAFARAVAGGGIVVVATHRLPIMMVLCQVLGIDPDRVWSVATAPASVTALEIWPDGSMQVAFVNDTHHLHDLDHATGRPPHS